MLWYLWLSLTHFFFLSWFSVWTWLNALCSFCCFFNIMFVVCFFCWETQMIYSNRLFKLWKGTLWCTVRRLGGGANTLAPSNVQLRVWHSKGWHVRSLMSTLSSRFILFYSTLCTCAPTGSEIERWKEQRYSSSKQRSFHGPWEDDRGIAFCYLERLVPSNSSLQVRRNCRGSRSFLTWKLLIFLFLPFSCPVSLVTSIRSYQCRMCPHWLDWLDNCQVGESSCSAPSYWEKERKKVKMGISLNSLCIDICIRLSVWVFKGRRAQRCLSPYNSLVKWRTAWTDKVSCCFHCILFTKREPAARAAPAGSCCVPLPPRTWDLSRSQPERLEISVCS